MTTVHTEEQGWKFMPSPAVRQHCQQLDKLFPTELQSW